MENILDAIAKATAEASDMALGLWCLIGVALVFFMQAGFAMVETGFTRAKNAGNIIMKNLMDFALGAVVFWLFGAGLILGDSVGGFIGTPINPFKMSEDIFPRIYVQHGILRYGGNNSIGRYGRENKIPFVLHIFAYHKYDSIPYIRSLDLGQRRLACKTWFCRFRRLYGGTYGWRTYGFDRRYHTWTKNRQIYQR